MIALPRNKFVAWTNAIETLLNMDKITHKELETLIGRLNHVGFIIPLARHFLGRLRKAMYTASHCQSISLNDKQ
jgi:hypothetical protein